jgi:hypothetical protein
MRKGHGKPAGVTRAPPHTVHGGNRPRKGRVKEAEITRLRRAVARPDAANSVF